MKKLTVISLVFEALSGLALIGIAIFYATVKDNVKFAVFLVVGVIFVIMPARTVYKYFKAKADEKRQREEENRHDFIK